MHVENVSTPPGARVGVILNRLQVPVCVTGHRVTRYVTQEANFPAAGISKRDPLHEGFQIGWISFTTYFHANQVFVGKVLVSIDRISNLAKIPAQFALLWANDGVTDRGQCRGCENQQDGARDN